VLILIQAGNTFVTGRLSSDQAFAITALIFYTAFACAAFLLEKKPNRNYNVAGESKIRGQTAAVGSGRNRTAATMVSKRKAERNQLREFEGGSVCVGAIAFSAGIFSKRLDD